MKIKTLLIIKIVFYSLALLIIPTLVIITRQHNQLKQIYTLLIIFLMVAFIAFLHTDYLLIYRLTLKSLSKLRDGTRIIGSGNLDFCIEAQKDDEIGELAHAINQMTVNLKNVTTSKADLENEIAKRKLYERALRKSEERYRTLAEKLREVDLRQSEDRFYKVFHNSPDMMAIIRAEDDSYVEVNNVFLNVFGYTRDELIGRTPIDMGIVFDDESRKKNLKILIEQGEFKNIEYVNYTKSGQIVNALCSAATIDFNGEVCWLLILKDITEKKRYEQEIARLDRLNLVGEMSASISHEIRNPMTTVRGYLQLLRQKDINRPYLDQFDLMIEELDRANGIITEFLSLARGKIVEMEPMNLQSTVFRLYPLITADSLLTDKRIELDLGQTADIFGDEKEIRQLILNLVRNGLEAMTAGGTLMIKIFQEESTVVLQVKDQGKGICQEVLNKLGTPFLTTKENGTGLGLAVCYSIALRHKAQISVVTGIGGTTFTVRIPGSVSGYPVVRISGGRSAEWVYNPVPGADIEYFI
ncbi:MAG: ATP-binding protein [Bacillota bacterium]